MRFLPGKYLVWKRSFRCSSFRPARRSCTCYFFCTNSITRRDFRCLYAQRQTWRGLRAGRPS